VNIDYNLSNVPPNFLRFKAFNEGYIYIYIYFMEGVSRLVDITAGGDILGLCEQNFI